MKKKVLLSVVLLMLFLLVGSAKQNYHVDEVFSFALANRQSTRSIYPDIEAGKNYIGEALFRDYTTVDPRHRFDYKNVWANQEVDVHPPLYYCLLHTVCSLAPEENYIWMGLAVNIPLSLIVFWQTVHMFEFMLEEHKLAIFFSLLYVLTMGFINSVVFFRMYMLLAVWTNALILLFLRYSWRREQTRQFYIALVLIIASGTLTQYYFLVFAFFACLVYGTGLIMRKKWKDLFLGSAASAGGIGIAMLLFPSMWQHIFSSTRGKQAFGGIELKKLFSVIKMIAKCDWQYFGHFSVVLVIILGIVLYRNRGCIAALLGREYLGKLAQCMIPAIITIVIIGMIAPYSEVRYVSNLSGIVYVCVFSLAYILLEKATNRKNWLFVLAVLSVICSYYRGLPNLYLGTKQDIDIIKEYSKIPCLYLYDGKHSTARILQDFMEMRPLEEITFVDIRNKYLLNCIKEEEYEQVLLYVMKDWTKKDILVGYLQNEAGKTLRAQMICDERYAKVYLVK